MGTRHDLVTPGAWVELRDADTITARNRKQVWQVMGGSAEVNDDGDIIMSRTFDRILNTSVGVAATVAAFLVDRWEAPYLPGGPQPGATADQLEDLRLPDFDRLLELVEPAVTLLIPSSSTNPDDHEDPMSPSEPASA